MKICHYNNNQAGVVVGDKVINFGDALIKAGLARQGYTMLEIIDALANNPAAMQIARDAANGSGGVDLKFGETARADPKSRHALGCGGELWRAPRRNGRSHGQRQQADHQQRRLDGGVFHQDHFVDHRPRRHDDFAEDVQTGRFRVRAVRRHRQAGAQSQRSGFARTMFSVT